MSSQYSSARNRDNNERRWGMRIEVDFPVRLEFTRGRSAPGRMRNASISGALIECAVELPTFSQVRVEILVTADGLRDPLLIPGRVVRAEHPRIGVEWRDLVSPEYAILLRANGLPIA